MSQPFPAAASQWATAAVSQPTLLVASQPGPAAATQPPLAVPHWPPTPTVHQPQSARPSWLLLIEARSVTRCLRSGCTGLELVGGSSEGGLVGTLV